MHLLKDVLFPILSALSLNSNENSCDMSRIAILGGGSVATTLAKALSDNQKDVVIASQDPAETKPKWKTWK
jgi:siroheme synthase (precorrin-2 oxidase/ferrochelatase)